MPEEDYRYRFCFLDTSLRATGVATYYFNVTPEERKCVFVLRNFFVIKTYKEDNRTTSTRSVIDQLSYHVERCKINGIVLEEPNVFHGSFQSKAMMAKAKSVMDIIGSCYMIKGYYYKAGMYVRSLDPSEWQPSAIQRASETKIWSMANANSILKTLKLDRVLRTKMDENIADAINIGHTSLRNYSKGIWSLPSTESLYKCHSIEEVL